MTFGTFMMMTLFQAVTTVWCIRWYMRKHPEEGRKMMMAAKDRLTKMMSR